MVFLRDSGKSVGDISLNKMRNDLLVPINDLKKIEDQLLTVDFK